MLDFLRWPFRSQKTHYEGKSSAQAQTQFTVSHTSLDSMGQLSGWIDRRADQNTQGVDKGPVDMQLPEQFFQDRLVTSSLSPEQVEKLGWNAHKEVRPVAFHHNKPEARQFKQVFVWQPYERETTMPFSQMPTRY